MPSARKSTAPEIESIRRAVVGLRRLFQRKELSELWARTFGDKDAPDYTTLRVLDAVRVAQEQAGEDGVTVGDLGRLLGVDPSRASRLVAAAVADGWLARQVDPADGRKSALKVTAAGTKLQARGSELTRARIALALDDWPAHDRAQLARLLQRFVEHLERDTP